MFRPKNRRCSTPAPSARRSGCPTQDHQQLFPVVVSSNGTLASRLLPRVQQDLAEGRRFSIFDMELGGTRYQIVTLLSYADTLRERPSAIFGFMVSLQWAREHYFKDLVAQAARIEGGDSAIEFAIVDQAGRGVIGVTRATANVPGAERSFPLVFFDPVTVAADPPSDLSIASWTAIATAQHDPTLAAADSGARRTLALAAIMTLVLTAGVWLSLQAARTGARLADMRADFISAVTHELKTPISNMRAIHETLASGRTTLETSREYGAMGIREATRLSRLVDNLLAYARITDVADAYSFEPVMLEAVVDRSLQEFEPHLTHEGFELHVELPEDLPPVKADPTALGLMLNNLVDNAIRYSRGTRWLQIAAHRENGDRRARSQRPGHGHPRGRNRAGHPEVLPRQPVQRGRQRPRPGDRGPNRGRSFRNAGDQEYRRPGHNGRRDAADRGRHAGRARRASQT